MIKLFNTLTRKEEEFIPINRNTVQMYCCGPTVYNYQHIGNLRTYIFEDLLKRVFIYNGYQVNHIVNITDVGHLTSDADEGEDKMEEGSKREGKSVWDIAKFYTDEFTKDLKRLNILEPDIWCKATDFIKEQIDMILCLERKGFTYKTVDGIYFDTSKLKDYGKLANLDIEGLRAGARIEVLEGKRNKTDFALWKFSPADKRRQMEWDSPWGKGFPGWHIECSAMSVKFLGEHFDVHCGGIDHIPIHHTNEIAQTESCTGKKFVNYWIHGEFLIDETGKMSKSKGEFLRLQTVIDKEYDPLDFRYLCLGTYYRKHLQFSWENLDSARNAFTRMKNIVREFKEAHQSQLSQNKESKKFNHYKQKYLDAINNDLNIPASLGVLWEVLREEEMDIGEKLLLAYDYDKVFGLNLIKAKDEKTLNISEEVLLLVQERTEAKNQKDFKKADMIREKVKELGYELVDKKDGVDIRKIER